MNTRVIGAILFVAAVVFCGFRILYDDGIVGMTKKPNHVFINPGCICHGDSAAASTKVWIHGPDSVRAGHVALFTISVARDSSVAAGFNVAAFLGSLEPSDTSETQLMEPGPGDSLELTHTHPKLAGGRDTISWSFYYRAPLAAGSIDTIYANGNSVNLSLDPDGDYWNFAPSFRVRVVRPTDVQENPVARSFILDQNYPNPFNPSTTLRYGLPKDARVSLSIYNILGQRIATLKDEVQSVGYYNVIWDGRNDFGSQIASGVYFYRIEAKPVDGGDAFTSIKKMLLLK